MKVANLTITGRIGPGFTVTTKVFPGISDLNFSFADNTIDVIERLKAQKHTVFDYQPTSTVTFSISGDTATITIS
jgi:hypothetical protein